ncbi:MAG: hypothetical protein L6R39_000292 [Caloplaca ligustica]|nr:MAG: hypothetical protein L6R39_000292 [Caloplaca ligustica]
MQEDSQTSSGAASIRNKTGFRNFDHGAADIVLAADFISSGSHLAVCSADHKIRLYAVKWIGPSLGLAFGTIADDNKFKLWREDPSQACQSGRRFRCVYSQSPSNHVSYVSLDFKTVKHELWLMLVSRDGLLSLLEPSEPESLRQWKEVDSVYPFGQQSRGSEPAFRLSLHQAETPSYGALSAGLDPKTISLCLSANSSIKILRATRSDDGNYQFHEMLDINGISSAINDVSWAPGSIRPHDLIAAACNDGCVRAYALTTPYKPHSASTGIGQVQSSPPEERHSSSLAIRQTPSGSAIVSTGDNGKLHLWKQDLKGDFIEFAETGPAWNR